MKQVLLILAIGMVASTPTSESNNTFQIVCSQSTLILRINQNGSLNCLVKELMRSENSTVGVNLAKIDHICKEHIQKPVIKVRHSIFNNETDIVEVLFRNISWQTQGSYLLSITKGNITKIENFRIQVYDVPALPKVSTIDYTTHWSSGSETFAFRAVLPKKEKCANNMSVSYTASYRIQSCSLRGQTGSFECKIVPNSDGEDRNIICFSESLLVCQNKGLRHCRLEINMTAINNYGNSTTLNFTSKSIYTAVNLPVAYLEKTSVLSRSLKISWPKPCAVYRYWYTIKYHEVGNSTVLMIENCNKEYPEHCLITNLRPATEYQICVAASKFDSYVRSKYKCIKAQTSEDVPSRSPKIIGVIKSQPQNGDIRWKIIVSWKLPNPYFWNGKAHVIVEYSELRKPNHVKESQNLSTNLTSYTLDSLYSDRDYFMRVNLCTKIGCKRSGWRYIARLPSKKGSTKWWIDLLKYSIPIVTVIGIVIIIFFLVRRRKKKRRYRELEDEGRENNDQTAEPIPVGPRDQVRPRDQVHVYEEPGSNLFHQYDDIQGIGYVDNTSIDSSIDDQEENLNIGQLQFQINDNPADGNENIELVS